MKKDLDYQDFLQDGEEESSLQAPKAVLDDLVGSRFKLILNYCFASALGYIASLMICAQCSVGLTAFAWKTSAFLHDMPDPWCPMICGVIFGLFPFLFSSLWITRFQHRYLLFKMVWVPLIVPLIANIVMSLLGPLHSMEWQAIWFAAAAATPYLAELLFRYLLKQKSFLKGKAA